MKMINGENQVKIFGVKIDKVTMDSAYNRFVSFMHGDDLKMIFTPNPEFVMKAQDDPQFKNILCEGDLVLPDGIGIIKASNIHNLGIKERVPGIEFMEKTLEYCHRSNKAIFLFGGRPGVADQAAIRIKEKYPNIIIKGCIDGFYEAKDELKILDRINEAKPDIIYVALGAPKQEKWIYKYRKILNAKVAMGVGGSLDVWAGVARRAPMFFVKLNLEWFYRLIKNPTRIGRMMVLPHFMIKVIVAKFIDR